LLRARASIMLFNWAGRFALAKFERKTRNSVKANGNTLDLILKCNRATAFSRAHDFDLIRKSGNRIAAYERAVPLSRFADYADDVERIARGEPKVLTADAVDVLAGSSGTTGAGKSLPNTKRARRKFMFFVPLVQQGVLAREIDGATSAQRGINLMSLYAPAPEKGATQPVMSALNAAMKSIRSQIPLMWSSPETVFTLSHQPTSFYLHALFGLVNRDALYISAVFAPQLASFFSLMEKYRDELVRNIESGKLASHLLLSESQRRSLECWLLPDPKRADELQTEFDEGFENIVPRIWPKMKYVVAVTTGSFSIHMPRLHALLGESVGIYTPCHGSSEAMIGINLRPRHDDYVLALGSAYFEFIPLAHSTEAQPDTVGIEELAVGQMYEVVLTNFAGLYRYRLEDVVRITGAHGTAPRFEFLYRKGAILNLVGEKITEYQTSRAVMACIEQCLGSAGHLGDYSVAGHTADGISNYIFYMEFEAGFQPTGANAKDISERLDLELCKANEYYRSSGRDTEALGPVNINFVKPGTFESLARMQDLVSDGTMSSQKKTPRVITRPEQLEILENAVVDLPQLH
jgi:hypothetical protein